MVYCVAAGQLAAKRRAAGRRNSWGTAMRPSDTAQRCDGGDGRLVPVDVKAATMPYNVRKGAQVSFGRVGAGDECLAHAGARHDLAGNFRRWPLRRHFAAEMGVSPASMRDGWGAQRRSGQRRSAGACRRGGARNPHSAQRPYTQLCGLPGRDGRGHGGQHGWSRSRARNLDFAQRPYTGMCGTAGRDVLGHRGQHGWWWCPSAECAFRATTLYAAVRVGRGRMVGVRAGWRGWRLWRGAEFGLHATTLYAVVRVGRGRTVGVRAGRCGWRFWRGAEFGLRATTL